MAYAATTDALALNPQGLDGLRYQASQHGGKEATRAAAQQFEAYFLQMMMQSMRQTLSQDGPFDSQETRTFSDMFDQQIAQVASKSQGMGLADVLVAQIEAAQAAPGTIVPAPRSYSLPSVPAAVTAPAQAANTPASQASTGSPRAFVDALWPQAVKAADTLGVSPHALLAQAALESGWGKKELSDATGNSFNLFNIKAGKNWTGKTVTAETTEYFNGKPVKQTALFRAYDSYAQAFTDYANTLKSNPRYTQALSQGNDAAAFASGLQAAGYATDPDYANKIMRVMSSPAFRAAA